MPVEVLKNEAIEKEIKHISDGPCYARPRGSKGEAPRGSSTSPWILFGTPSDAFRRSLLLRFAVLSRVSLTFFSLYCKAYASSDRKYQNGPEMDRRGTRAFRYASDDRGHYG